MNHMTENKTDLRVIKTHENLINSFLKLLEKKSLKDITVKEICTEAKCSRNTFYMHYQYKEDLYHELTDECINAIRNASNTVTDNISFVSEEIIQQYINNTIDEMDTKKDIFRVLLKSDQGALFHLRMMDSFYEYFLDGYQTLVGTKPDEKYCLYAKYSASAIVGFILHWLLYTDLPSREAKEILNSIHCLTIDTIIKYMKKTR